MHERSDTAVLERLRVLERELLALRRSLGASGQSLPAEPFDALTLQAGGVPCAIPVARVIEVAPVPWCQPVPDAPGWLLGTFRYGQLSLPAIDLPHRLGAPRTAVRAAHLLAIVGNGTRAEAGLLFETVGDIVHIVPESVAPVADNVPQAPFLLGTIPEQHATRLLLSVDRLCRDAIFDESPDEV